MPVQLPLQPPGVNLPPEPQDPPTIADVVKAKSYQARVDVAVASQAPGAPTAPDAARADVYKTNVILAHSALDAAPAWFQPAMIAMLAPIQITLAQTRNHQLHDGSVTPFTIVPFNDGTMPTQAPHNLPPLHNVASIRALTGPQAGAYTVGYGLGNIRAVRARKDAIGGAIGCAVNIHND